MADVATGPARSLGQKMADLATSCTPEERALLVDLLALASAEGEVEGFMRVAPGSLPVGGVGTRLPSIGVSAGPTGTHGPSDALARIEAAQSLSGFVLDLLAR